MKDNKLTYENLGSSSEEDINTLNTESIFGDRNYENEDNFVVVKQNMNSKRWFFRANEPRRLRWDLWIMFLATFNCFQVPYNVAFDTKENIFTYTINAIIDVFFILDIFINFRTSIVSELDSEEIFDQKKVALRYLRSKFFIDFLASIPFDYFVLIFSTDNNSSFIFELFSLLKLVRVLRLSRLITHLNLRNEVKVSLRLIKLIFFLIMYLHWVGCAWYYIVKQNKEWIPPLDYVYITTNLYEESNFYKYCSSMYHSVLMLGGNDLGPRGEFQYIFISLILVFGALINAILFGNMGVMLQSLSRKTSDFQAKLDNANDAMKNLNIPDAIKDDVKYYISYTQSTLDHQNELDSFLAMLSPSLKQRVVRHIFYDTILKTSVFEGNHEILKELLPDLTIRLFMPEDKIIRQSEDPEGMFFIAKGECDVFVTDNNGLERYTTTLTNSHYFGEVAILKNCKRTASVVSKYYSTCAHLNKYDLQALWVRYPKIKHSMELRMRKHYQDKWKIFIK